MYLCVRGVPSHDREWSCICVMEYQAMTKNGHIFVRKGVSSHDREWSCICVLGGIKP